MTSISRSAPVSRQASLAPIACLVAVGSLLGVTANLAKIAAEAGWPPLAFLCWSIMPAGLILLGSALAFGQAPGRRRSDLAYYLISGLFSIALPNALGFGAVAHVGASFISLCLALPPLLTYAAALALRMERFKATRAVGILFGLAGAATLAVAKARGAAAEPLWIAGALCSPIFIVFGNIYRTLRWPAGASALSLAPGMLIAGSLLTIPILALAGIPFAPTALRSEALWLLAAQTLVFALTYALYFVLQKIAGPVYLSQIGSVAAIVGAALAVAALGEPAGPALFAAAGLILIGVVLVNRRR
jgi:drug/metabolite transporter (DMT)-like permease